MTQHKCRFLLALRCQAWFYRVSKEIIWIFQALRTTLFHNLFTHILRFGIRVSTDLITPQRSVGDLKLLFHSLHNKKGTQSCRNRLGFGWRPGWDRDVRTRDAEQSRDLLVPAVWEVQWELPGSTACGFGEFDCWNFSKSKASQMLLSFYMRSLAEGQNLVWPWLMVIYANVLDEWTGLDF